MPKHGFDDGPGESVPFRHNATAIQAQECRTGKESKPLIPVLTGTSLGDTVNEQRPLSQ